MAAPFAFNDEVYNSIYPGWGRTEAQADWNLYGEQKWKDYQNKINPPAQTPEQFADTLLKSQEEQIKRETSFLEQYTKDNPFVFDEELARKSASQEYTPYYSELLNDYVSDIEKKRETTRGESELLTTLQKIDRSGRSRAYSEAVNKAEEGFSGQGMFFSGIRQSTTGLQDIGYKEGSAASEARFGNEQANIGRTLEGYDTAESRQTRDIGRAKDVAIEGGILQRNKEAQTQYYTPLEQSYYRQFPTGSGSALKGYTVPEYFRY